MIGATSDWSRLDEFLIAYVVEPALRSTALASSLAATLELVREGALEVHQTGAFAPIYLRKRIGGNGGEPAASAASEVVQG
jgi:segregation and condensation protein A